MDVRFQPKNGSYWRLPPMINGLPSGNRIMPLQNMSQLCAPVVTVLLEGSHTPTIKVVCAGSFPEPETTKFFPLFSNAVWIGLIGIRVGRVRQVPFRLAWPCAIGAHVASKAIAASTQICLLEPDRSLVAHLLSTIPMSRRNCAL